MILIIIIAVIHEKCSISVWPTKNRLPSSNNYQKSKTKPFGSKNIKTKSHLN